MISFVKIKPAMQTFVGMFAVIVFSIVPAMGQNANVQVELTNGKTAGELLAVEIDSISLNQNGDSKKYAFDQLSKIDFGVPSAIPMDQVINVLLVDGSVLNAKEFSISKRMLQLELTCGLKLEISTRDVVYVKFSNYENDLELSRQWRELLADESREGDAIVVNRSKELDAVEGIVGELADEKLEFSIGDQTARVPLSRVEAILFYRAKGRELARAVSKICLVDDSILVTRRMKLESDSLVATTVCGSVAALSLDCISIINFELGRDALLSELTPATNDWKPLISSASILEQLRRLKLARANETFSGEPLSLRFFSDENVASPGQIKQFENGFSVQGGSRLAFNLNGQYETLSGWVGFNPEASLSGRVMFRVVLDGEAVLEKELSHRTMKNPLKLEIAIKDVDRIVFQVGYHDGRSTGDQLHLVDLKVSR